MKKAVLILLSLILFSSLFASDFNVCIYPSNEQLENSVKEYFDVNIVKSKISPDLELVLTGDFRLLEYICYSCNADFLLVPVVENISGYYYQRLYSFSKESRVLKREYETINQDNNGFDFEFIKSLYSSYTDSEAQILDYVMDQSVTEFVYSEHPVMLECKNTVADIYINDKYLGQTPYKLESYSIPSNIRFCAEGFADRVYSILNDKSDVITVTLISDIKSDASRFSKAQNRYFASFAATILGWGSRIAVDALNIQNATLKKVLDISTLTLAVSSSGLLAYNIFDYFRTTQNVAP